MSVKYFIHVLLVATMLVVTTIQAQPPEWVAPPGFERAIEVQERYTPALMAREGIEGTGIGYDDNGEVAIKVYTARAGVPGIPHAIEQVPVQTVVTGRFVARDIDPTAKFPQPVPIGISTGHPDITAGTIGARVKGACGNVFALSNNHVYANSNDATNGDNVLQPGPIDGGQDPADAIGTLYDFEPIKFDGSDNIMDAAIAVSTTGALGHATPGGVEDSYGAPGTTIATASIGQTVQKYGRTTGWTHGTVSERNVTVDVCYATAGPFRCKKLARFVKQIAITDGAFSDGGDSGSLIVTDNELKNPVGLLFAGSTTHTIANPIGPVLDRFSVTIDDGSGGNDSTNCAPTAAFSYEITDRTATFTDQSTDNDGSIVSWSWSFGDGATSTAQNPNHSYGEDGTYTVMLTVSDNDGATGTHSEPITVTTAATGPITLTATGYKVRGRQKVDLEWSGATTPNVDVYRDGKLIVSPTENDGLYTDNIDRVGGGSYIYRICEEGSVVTCSNDVTVTF